MGIRGQEPRGGLRDRALAVDPFTAPRDEVREATADLQAIRRIREGGDYVVPRDLYARVIRALRAAGEIECCGEATCLIETVRIGCRQLVDELREECGREGGGR